MGTTRITENVGVKDSGDTRIDPSTKGNQTTLITRAEAIRDRIGAIAASPAANTVQDRLKTLAAKLDSVLASIGTTGSAAPSSATLIGGTDGTNLRAALSRTDGSLIAAAPDRANIAGLSFVETLTALATHTTSWVDVSQIHWLSITVEVASASAVDGVVEFTNAADPNTTAPGANDISKPFEQQVSGTALGGPADVVNFSLSPSMRWCRIKATDVTGGQAVKVSAFGSDVASNAAILPIAASVTNDFGAALVQAIGKAEDPSQTYHAIRHSGKVASQSSTTTITAGGNFTGSEWVSNRGYSGAAVFIKSDANTATNGLQLQVSYDGGVTVHDTKDRTYDAAPDGRTYKFAIATPGDCHIRTKVTAGASDMTSLVMGTWLLANEVEDVSIPLDDLVSGGMVGDLTKSQIVGKDSASAWHNGPFTTTGYPQYAVAQHDVPTPIKALDGSYQTSQFSVPTTTATRVDSSPLAGRKTIRVKSVAANTVSVYVGPSGVTTSTGDELSPGEAVEFEFDDTVGIFAITGTGGQVLTTSEAS